MYAKSGRYAHFALTCAAPASSSASVAKPFTVASISLASEKGGLRYFDVLGVLASGTAAVSFLRGYDFAGGAWAPRSSDAGTKGGGSQRVVAQ